MMQHTSNCCNSFIDRSLLLWFIDYVRNLIKPLFGTFAGHRRKSIKMLLMLSMTRTRKKSRWLPDWWRCFMFVTNSIFLAPQRCTYFSAISNIGYAWILSFSREKEKEIEYHKPLFFYKTKKEFVIEKDVSIYFLVILQIQPKRLKISLYSIPVSFCVPFLFSLTKPRSKQNPFVKCCFF